MGFIVFSWSVLGGGGWWCFLVGFLGVSLVVSMFCSMGLGWPQVRWDGLQSFNT